MAEERPLVQFQDNANDGLAPFRSRLAIIMRPSRNGQPMIQQRREKLRESLDILENDTLFVSMSFEEFPNPNDFLGLLGNLDKNGVLGIYLTGCGQYVYFKWDMVETDSASDSSRSAIDHDDLEYAMVSCLDLSFLSRAYHVVAKGSPTFGKYKVHATIHCQGEDDFDPGIFSRVVDSLCLANFTSFEFSISRRNHQKADPITALPITTTSFRNFVGRPNLVLIFNTPHFNADLQEALATTCHPSNKICFSAPFRFDGEDEVDFRWPVLQHDGGHPLQLVFSYEYKKVDKWLVRNLSLYPNKVSKVHFASGVLPEDCHHDFRRMSRSLRGKVSVGKAFTGIPKELEYRLMRIEEQDYD